MDHANGKSREKKATYKTFRRTPFKTIEICWLLTHTCYLRFLVWKLFLPFLHTGTKLHLLPDMYLTKGHVFWRFTSDKSNDKCITPQPTPWRKMTQWETLLKAPSTPDYLFSKNLHLQQNIEFIFVTSSSFLLNYPAKFFWRLDGAFHIYQNIVQKLGLDIQLFDTHTHFI